MLTTGTYQPIPQAVAAAPPAPNQFDRVVLIGNYQPDGQESMLRFTNMLQQALEGRRCRVQQYNPPALLGKIIKARNSGIGKWVGYVDKYIVFPVLLFAHRVLPAHRRAHYHICDHSNAPYANWLPGSRTSITCHDVIAIKGGLGLDDTCPPGSTFGVILQKWILKHLASCRKVACVSQVTLSELASLNAKPGTTAPGWRVIYNAFNNNFYRMEPAVCRQVLHKVQGLASTPFILHVGSDLPRKNRRLLLEMLAELEGKWSGVLCVAGETPGPDFWHVARNLHVAHKVVVVNKPGHQELLALYSACEAFVFPSLSEGFGWPVIEAQACGAPVIASNIHTLTEVSGGAALHVATTNARAFANALLQLQDNAFCNQLVERGYVNCARFAPAKMIEDYLHLFNQQ